jgi:hypothetical protein
VANDIQSDARGWEPLKLATIITAAATTIATTQNHSKILV